MMSNVKAVFDVTKIFFGNMNRYPGLFWLINGTRNLSSQDQDALTVLVSKAMSDVDVDAAMAILNKYRTDGLENPT